MSDGITKADLEAASLQIKLKQYICPTHGDIGANVLTSYIKGLEMDLCLHCYIEKMVEIGVQKVTVYDKE